MEDYYRILGVSQSTSREEIKIAYRKLAHIHHPDKGGDAKIMKKINVAYEMALKACGDKIVRKNSFYHYEEKRVISKCTNCGADTYYTLCLTCWIEILKARKRKRINAMSSRLVCLNCNKSLYPRPSNTKYCDSKCAREYHRKNIKSVSVCVNCNKPLKNKWMKYCDRKCRKEYRRNLGELSEEELRNVLERRKQAV